MVKKKRTKDPIAQLRTKLSKVKQTLRQLLKENDHTELCHHFNNYNRTKNPSSKRLYSKYKKWNHTKNNILKLQRELLTKYNTHDEESDNVDVDEEASEENLPLVKCDNCFRHHISNCTSDYTLNLSLISSSDIIGSRPFCNLKGTRSRDSVEYNVCIQCKTHLTLGNTEEATEEKNTWPALVWQILSSDETISTYGGTFIWKLIPFEWRSWWYMELKTQFPTAYYSVTKDAPVPIFSDRTSDLKEWDNAIESKQLSQLANICNKLLIPTVLCPWGCSEFLHHAGTMNLNVVFQRYLCKCYLLDDSNALTKIEPARDDFIRENKSDYDKWLENIAWRVLPTIVMKDGTPMVLTCKDHCDGSSHFHLHCPRTPTNISAHLSDQLCHAVVKPRTVKTMKIGYNSTSYQMVEQRTSWKGPDSINVSSCGRMNHNSVLLREAEARSYNYRTDMKSLIKRLIDDNKMSQDHAEGIEQYATFLDGRFDFLKLKRGSTYVPTEVAISMKEEARNREITGIVDDDIDEDGELMAPYSKKFKHIWPLYIYPCQKVCKHGWKMHTVAVYQVTNSMLLWLVSSLLIKVEAIWNILALSELKTSEWIGYLLIHLTKTSLHHINRRAVGIFPNMNITELVNLLSAYHDNLGMYQSWYSYFFVYVVHSSFFHSNYLQYGTRDCMY